MKLPPLALVAPSLCPRCDQPAMVLDRLEDQRCAHCGLQLHRCGSCHGVAGPLAPPLRLFGPPPGGGGGGAPPPRPWVLARPSPPLSRPGSPARSGPPPPLPTSPLRSGGATSN